MSPTRALLATPLHHAVEGHFAPFVRLTLSTLALAVGAMFAVATTRTASAFAEPQSYLGRFINREFYADYSSAADRPTQLIAVTRDAESGLETARTIEINAFTELRTEILDSANADATARERAPRAIESETSRGANVLARAAAAEAASDAFGSNAPARPGRRAAVQPEADGDPSSTEPAETTSDRTLERSGRPTRTPVAIGLSAPDAPAPRPAARPTRVPFIEPDAPVPTNAPVATPEPMPTKQPQPTAQPIPDRRNLEVLPTPGGDLPLPTVMPTLPTGNSEPPTEPGNGGGNPTTTPPSPTPGSPSDTGPLSTVPTLAPSIVPSVGPQLPTVVPVLPPTAVPTQPSSSGSGSSGSGGSGSGSSGSGGSGSGKKGSPTLVPTVPPPLPTVPVVPTVDSILLRI